MFFIFPIAPLYIIAYIDSRVMKSSIKDTIKRYVSKKIDFFLKHLGLLRIGNASKSLRELKDRLTSIVEEKLELIGTQRFKAVNIIVHILLLVLYAYSLSLLFWTLEEVK